MKTDPDDILAFAERYDEFQRLRKLELENESPLFPTALGSLASTLIEQASRILLREQGCDFVDDDDLTMGKIINKCEKQGIQSPISDDVRKARNSLLHGRQPSSHKDHTKLGTDLNTLFDGLKVVLDQIQVLSQSMNQSTNQISSV